MKDEVDKGSLELYIFLINQVNRKDRSPLDSNGDLSYVLFCLSASGVCISSIVRNYCLIALDLSVALIFGDIVQVTEPFLIIKAIADNKYIRHYKTAIINIDSEESFSGIVKEGTYF